MKDLKLDKQSLVALQDDQLDAIIGATDRDTLVSCKKTSCNDGGGDTITEEIDIL